MSNLEANRELIPGQKLIYEHADGVTYARYRDAPHNKIPRWIIGGHPTSVARAKGELLDYTSWKELCEISQTNPTLKNQLNKVVNLYYLIKDDQTSR